MEVEVESIGDSVELSESFFRTFERAEQFIYRLKISEAATRHEPFIQVAFEDILAFSQPLATLLHLHPGRALDDLTRAFKSILAFDIEVEDTVNYEVRLCGEFPEVFLRSLHSMHVDKLVHVRGVVNRLSTPKPQLTIGRFECSVCQTITILPQEGLELVKPECCSNPNCQNKKSFKLVSEESSYIDVQWIAIQETQDQLLPGEIPRVLKCQLRHGLIDTIKPGERVRITGIFRATPSENNRGKKLTLTSPYIEANNIEGFKIEEEKLQLSAAEEQQIRILSREPEIQAKIARSIAPAIWGHDRLKMAACFSLFGGVPKVKTNGSKIRGDIHVLFMGDPGTGKSQILQFCSKLILRSVYTNGRGSSAAGLTAAVIREPESSGFSLEAGALALASGGIACIDEFDKMEKNDRSAIHEAMEQQTITISKAGLHATLQSKTAIIAAANPKWGRYNTYKSALENINLSPTIMSRFDLLFLVKDIPKIETDAAVMDAVIRNQMLMDDDDEDVIPVDLLRKYIFFARENCHPILTDDVAQRIKDFYLQVRAANPQNVTIVVRYAEGLFRMTEAHAKMALKSTVDLEDVEIAINLLQQSLQDVCVDTDGNFNIDALLCAGSPPKETAKMAFLLDLIKELQSHNHNQAVLIADIIEKAKAEMSEGEAEEIIQILFTEGTIYKPVNDKICFTGGVR